MADFYEVATDNGLVAVNMDSVEKIEPSGSGSRIFFRSNTDDVLMSTESPGEILQGLEEYNQVKALEIWKRTHGKNT